MFSEAFSNNLFRFDGLKICLKLGGFVNVKSVKRLPKYCKWLENYSNILSEFYIIFL